MDKYFEGLDGRFRVSLTDSTMMKIVHSAMDKAHERVQSKDGVIARLSEISKFYELAVMQIEGCMKFIQEESEDHEEEVLIDLMEVRDRLQQRLIEAELAISDKDRELVERLENELKLRNDLEIKERELGRVTDDTFCELKHSVDQQVWNIKQKLDPDHKTEEIHEGIDDQHIERMGTDIDILKNTLDLAFGKMQNAICLSEVGPIEQQWGWSIERDTSSILIKGFLSDTGSILNQTIDLKEITCLRDDLEAFSNEFEVQAKKIRGMEVLTYQSNIPLKIKKRSLSEGDCFQNPDNKKGCCEDDQKEEGGHSVAKIIKSHESIIRRKSGELSWLKKEYLKEKVCSSYSRGKEPANLKTRIEDVIKRLNGLIQLNATVDERKKAFEFGVAEKKNPETDSLVETLKKMNQERERQLNVLKQEKEDASFQTTIMETIYATLLRGLLSEFVVKLLIHEGTSSITEGIYEIILTQTVSEWNKKFDRYQDEDEVRQEITRIVVRELYNEFKEGIENYSDESIVRELICEDICMVFLSKVIEACGVEICLREDIYQFVILEAVKCACTEPPNHGNFTLKPLSPENSDLDSDLISRESSELVGLQCGELNELEAEKDAARLMLTTIMMENFEVVNRFENLAKEKLELNNSRLLEARQHFDELVVSLRKNEFLYKKGFMNRCQNLLKAEAEVDLLGDQVDRLVNLLVKLYNNLHCRSTLLEPHSEVSEMLDMIRQELL